MVESNTSDFRKKRTIALARCPVGLFGTLVILLSLSPYARTSSASPIRGPVVSVTDYGARGDGQVKDTEAIQKAIDACAASGGGTVYFPAGTYLSGSIHLKNWVTVNLGAGARICASTDEADFDPYEKLDFKNDADKETSYFHYSLIWGEDVSHVAILGQGAIDGNREERGGPKPIALKRGRFITIRDISIVNAPNYCISLLGCDYVNIDGVTLLNGYCDGIDPDSCRNVRISNCYLDCYDDAIVLKSSFSLGERRATENVTVTNCILSTNCNAFKMGTESGGGFKWVTFSNSVIYSRPKGRHTISGIALQSVDGADVEGITITNISMRDVQAPIAIRLGNRGRDMETPIPGALRNITISNVEAAEATLASSITGIPDHPVERVTLSNIRVQFRGGSTEDLSDKEVPEEPKRYPSATMFGELPSCGLYCRHAKNITVRDFHVWCVSSDQRPALIFDDVEQLTMAGLTGENVGLSSFIRLQNVRKALLQGCFAPKDSETFLQIRGEQSAQIRVIGNDLGQVGQAFDMKRTVPKKAFFQTANNLKRK